MPTARKNAGTYVSDALPTDPIGAVQYHDLKVTTNVRNGSICTRDDGPDSPKAEYREEDIGFGSRYHGEERAWRFF